MEREARAIHVAVSSDPAEEAMDLAKFPRSLFGPSGGFTLDLPERDQARDPPKFDDAVLALGMGHRS